MSFDVVMIGGGNMGAALLGGMIDSGSFEAEAVAVVEVRAERRAELAERWPGLTVAAEVPACTGAVVAVKPNDVPSAVSTAVSAGATHVLSIAAGVTLATLEGAAGPGVGVVRAMPNTPALVGEGVAAISGGASAGDDDLGWATTILGSVGIVEVLPEPLLDVVTGVAGSGPAYLFLVAEAMTDAAVAQGLARSTAVRIVNQLFLGSSTLLARDGDASALRVAVTSPGGTTAAGLARLEEHAVRSAFAAAVEAATSRSRDLA